MKRRNEGAWLFLIPALLLGWLAAPRAHSAPRARTLAILDPSQAGKADLEVELRSYKAPAGATVWVSRSCVTAIAKAPCAVLAALPHLDRRRFDKDLAEAQRNSEWEIDPASILCQTQIPGGTPLIYADKSTGDQDLLCFAPSDGSFIAAGGLWGVLQGK